MNLPRLVQITILLLFIGEFVAMSFGFSIVPKDPETKQYFYALQSVFLTILSVPTLATMIQNYNKGDSNSTPPKETPVQDENKTEVE